MTSDAPTRLSPLRSGVPSGALERPALLPPRSGVRSVAPIRLRPPRSGMPSGALVRPALRPKVGARP